MDKCLLRDKRYVLAYEHGKSILLAFDALCGYGTWEENSLTSVNINMISMLYLEPPSTALQHFKHVQGLSDAVQHYTRFKNKHINYCISGDILFVNIHFSLICCD